MNYRIRPLFAVIFALGISHRATAEFTNFPINDLAGVQSSSVSWADYDNDGRMDFLITGTTNGTMGAICQLWRNTGTGFTNVPMVGVPGVFSGGAVWGDFDNDGRMDFILTGSTNGALSGAVSQIWRNTGSGFTNMTGTLAPNLPDAFQSACAWGDFNNDGRPDFILMGECSTGRIAQIWSNTGTGFTNVTSQLAPDLAGVEAGFLAVGDFDNDGDLDFLIGGELANLQRVTQLWQNTGAGFINVTSSLAPGLPNVLYGSAAWADFDKDGKLDFLLTGSAASSRIAQVWRNTGIGFTNLPIANLAGVRYSSAQWGDYDNDGKTDFLITGDSSSGSVSEIWRNTGNTFTNIDAGLPGVFSLSAGSTAWADYDNDGRLDLLLSGTATNSGLAQVWRNLGGTINTPPPAPMNLVSSVSGGSVSLTWSSPTDAESGTNLSFNVRIGTTPGGSDVVNPQADTVNGFRRLPALGNSQLNTSYSLRLPPGKYYWSVQAIDGAFAGGSFATEATFDVVRPTLTISRSGTNVTLSWQPADTNWILQETLTLKSAWSNSPSGPTNPITLPISQPTKFFRLVRP